MVPERRLGFETPPPRDEAGGAEGGDPAEVEDATDEFVGELVDVADAGVVKKKREREWRG